MPESDERNLMAHLGKRNTLRISGSTDHGFLLESREWGDILLPNAYVDTSMAIGAEVEVFLYKDSEDRIVATTETPLVEVGEFACLEVIATHPRMGCFLDWGLRKDLLLPYREQGERTLRKGDRVVVAVFIDPHSSRIVASTRLHRHFSEDVPSYPAEQPVDVLIYGKSPLGYKAVVDGKFSGLLFRGETSDDLRYGDQFKGYVKQVHPDGKIDILRDPAGFKKRVLPLAEEILEKLSAAGGHLPYTDKSPSAEIRSAFGCSKQSFKQALGTLYKQRRIVIGKDGVRVA